MYTEVTESHAGIENETINTQRAQGNQLRNHFRMHPKIK